MKCSEELTVRHGGQAYMRLIWVNLWTDLRKEQHLVSFVIRGKDIKLRNINLPLEVEAVDELKNKGLIF